MAGTITRLVYQKRNRQRVNVYIDDVYAFAVPDIEAARLRIGQTINDEEIARLQQIGEDARALDRALRLLAVRPRSAAEMSTRLRQAGFAEAVCDRVLDRLQEQGYINDAEFVQWWLQNRNQFHPSGRRLLSAELRRKGIVTSLINQALAELDETALAVAAARQRVRRWGQLPGEDFRRKMLAFLQRRGFDYTVARQACERVWADLHSEDPDTNLHPPSF